MGYEFFKYSRVHIPILICFLVLGYEPSSAQTLLTDIDLTRIAQKKIKKFFSLKIDEKIESFSDLQKSVNENDALDSFRIHEKTYVVKAPLNKVWGAYVNTDPTKAWSGKMMNFGIMYSGGSDEIIYANDQFGKMEQGQICFIGFKIWGGFYKLAASFEVSQVDPTQRLLEFTYMAGGKTNGRQRVRFTETPEGWTRIVHTTRYKSGSNFRDKRLYPHFHTVAIDEFHANMQKGLGLKN